MTPNTSPIHAPAAPTYTAVWTAAFSWYARTKAASQATSGQVGPIAPAASRLSNTNATTAIGRTTASQDATTAAVKRTRDIPHGSTPAPVRHAFAHPGLFCAPTLREVFG